MKKAVRAGKKEGAGGRAAAKKPRAPSAQERRRVVAELRAFAHPLRLRLFELFAEKARTTMQVAEILGEPPTRLYHHVNALQKSGLLKLKETRPIRGTVEKYFEAVKPGMQKDVGGVLRTSATARQSALAAAGALLEQVRQDLHSELAGSKHDGPGAVMLRMMIGASPTRAASIQKRLLAFLKELRAECGGDPDGEPESGALHARELGKDEERWALTVAFTRSWPRRRGDAAE